MFVCEYEGFDGLEFDLICMVKGIVDGLLLLVVIGCVEIMNVLYVGGLGGMFGGNLVVCVVVLVIIVIIESDGLIEWVC